MKRPILVDPEFSLIRLIRPALRFAWGRADVRAPQCTHGIGGIAEWQSAPSHGQVFALSTVDPHVEEAQHGCEHSVIRVDRRGQALDDRHALF